MRENDGVTNSTSLGCRDTRLICIFVGVTEVNSFQMTGEFENFSDLDNSGISGYPLAKFDRNKLCPLCGNCFKPKLSKRAFYGIESQAGVYLEILLGAKLDGESFLTDIICRNCVRNNVNFV